MHPVVKRILVNGGLTAALLTLIGLLFVHLASLWTMATPVRPGSADLNPPMTDSLRNLGPMGVPLMMAFWGFVFVAGCELVLWRIRGNKPVDAKPAESQPVDVEKLLNELLAQSEAKMALEQESGIREQETGDKRQETEAQKPQ